MVFESLAARAVGSVFIIPGHASLNRQVRSSSLAALGLGTQSMLNRLLSEAGGLLGWAISGWQPLMLEVTSIPRKKEIPMRSKLVRWEFKDGARWGTRGRPAIRGRYRTVQSLVLAQIVG